MGQLVTASQDQRLRQTQEQVKKLQAQLDEQEIARAGFQLQGQAIAQSRQPDQSDIPPSRQPPSAMARAGAVMMGPSAVTSANELSSSELSIADRSVVKARIKELEEELVELVMLEE